MSEGSVPDERCAVCGQPAVVSTRSPDMPEGIDLPEGELVPLCAEHAEEADEPEVIEEA